MVEDFCDAWITAGFTGLPLYQLIYSVVCTLTPCATSLYTVLVTHRICTPFFSAHHFSLHTISLHTIPLHPIPLHTIPLGPARWLNLAFQVILWAYPIPLRPNPSFSYSLYLTAACNGVVIGVWRTFPQIHSLEWAAAVQAERGALMTLAGGGWAFRR